MISKLEQFIHENKTWGRSLDFLRQESIFLKNRLSEVVDDKEGKEFIMLAEYFNNQFILKDEFINDLKTEVDHQQKIISANFNNDDQADKILRMQEKLRNEIDFFEKDFSILKNKFNTSIVQFL